MTHATETMTAGCVAWSVVVVVVVVVVVGGAATGSADVRTQRLPNTNGQSLVDVNNDWSWCCDFPFKRAGLLKSGGATQMVLKALL